MKADMGVNPSTGLYPTSVEKIRSKEYPSLKATTYLDHAGATPFPKSLIKEFEKDMNSHLFGNPHSRSPSSMLSTDRVESTRIQALKFFKADPEHFDLIFVANATAAIKLVMDCMSDYSRSKQSNGFWYGYHGDSHTSLVGVREVAGSGSRCFDSDEAVNEWLHLCERSQRLYGDRVSNKESPLGLFAYPAQSNMDGRRLPSDWAGRLRATKSKIRQIYSLLDASAYVATAQLDLSDWKNAADFIALSFYKIFGFPDLGALIVRKASGHVLKARKYFGGGTVDMVINGDDDTKWDARKATSLHEMLEDGTPAFHSIGALRVAFKTHQKLYGSMTNVSKHTAKLIKVLYKAMSTLSHANGVPVCEIYNGRRSEYGESKTQGPTIAFNVRNSSGEWIGKSDFERVAIINNIQIRTGGVCNPGGVATSLQISPAEMRENFEEGLRCGNELDKMHGKPTGIVRVSLGAMSSMEDIERFMKFMQLFVDQRLARPRSTLPRVGGENSLLHRPLQTLGSKAVTEVKKDNEKFDCSITASAEDFRSKEGLWDQRSAHYLHATGKRSRWRYRLCGA